MALPRDPQGHEQNAGQGATGDQLFAGDPENLAGKQFGHVFSGVWIACQHQNAGRCGQHEQDADQRLLIALCEAFAAQQ